MLCCEAEQPAVYHCKAVHYNLTLLAQAGCCATPTLQAMQATPPASLPLGVDLRLLALVGGLLLLAAAVKQLLDTPSRTYNPDAPNVGDEYDNWTQCAPCWLSGVLLKAAWQLASHSNCLNWTAASYVLWCPQPASHNDSSQPCLVKRKARAARSLHVDVLCREGILEYYWGEHIHLGYYSAAERAAGYKKKDFKRAKIDFVDEMLRWSGAQAPARVLDVGCGIGGTSRHLAARFPDAQVQGMPFRLHGCAPGELQRLLGAELVPDDAGLGLC